MTLENYRKLSWVDFTTNGWMGIEPISVKHWKELPDDYMIPAAGPNSSSFRIIVGGGRRPNDNNIYSIDAWR